MNKKHYNMFIIVTGKKLIIYSWCCESRPSNNENKEWELENWVWTQFRTCL